MLRGRRSAPRRAGGMAALPSWMKPQLARWLFGWDVHPTAYIGRSIILVNRVCPWGPMSSIGPFNVIRDLEELRLGEGASIASRNWITGWLLSAEVFGIHRTDTRLSSWGKAR